MTLFKLPELGIRNIPLIKLTIRRLLIPIHLDAGADNQYNISRVMHLNKWSIARWAASGGDVSRAVIVINPVEIPKKNYAGMAHELGLEGKFIYGFHHRDDDTIFSPMPLEAYKKIETDQTAFALLGGGISYRNQAKELGIKNIVFIPATGEQDIIYNFLATLNVYAHGRRDGEINSRAMGEAMYFGLPIVSHTSPVNNGHIESIGDAGLVVSGVGDYVKEMERLRNDREYYAKKSAAAKKRFAEHYALDSHINQIVALYEDVP